MEIVLATLAVLTILFTPFLSGAWIDSIFARLALVAAIVFAIRQGPLSGILVFLAVFSLFTERNQDILTKLPGQRPASLRNTAAGYGFPIQAPALVPVTESLPFDMPQEEGKSVVESNGESTTVKFFEDASDLSDNNPRLEEAPTTDADGFFREHGLV